MHVFNLVDQIAAKLQEDLNYLTHSIQDCPLYAHVSVSHEDRYQNRHAGFTIVLATTKKDFVVDRDKGAQVVCELVSELLQGRVMVRVRTHRMPNSRRELGQTGDWWNGNNSYRQAWRDEEFLMELSAPALWNLLERTVDFEKIALHAVEEVSQS